MVANERAAASCMAAALAPAGLPPGKRGAEAGFPRRPSLPGIHKRSLSTRAHTVAQKQLSSSASANVRPDRSASATSTRSYNLACAATMFARWPSTRAHEYRVQCLNVFWWFASESASLAWVRARARSVSSLAMRTPWRKFSFCKERALTSSWPTAPTSTVSH